MKKILFALILSATGICASAQSFEKQMEAKIVSLDKTNSPAELSALKDEFVLIHSKNEKQWLPSYYAAFATIKEGYALLYSADKSNMKHFPKTAVKYLSGIAYAQKNNAEVSILRGFANTLEAKISGNKTVLDEAAQMVAQAEKTDKDNPRLMLLKAEIAYLRGNTAMGDELLAAAEKRLATAKPKSAIAPHWGIKDFENIGK